jgi:transcriptional regulator with XRE-family HTH domain
MSSGHFIKLLRIVKGITQKSVSQNLNISQQAYSKIERSKNIDKVALQRILAAIESSPKELEELKNILSQSQKTSDSA